MQRLILVIMLTSFALFASGCAAIKTDATPETPEAAPSLTSLAWMTGVWISVDSDMETIEAWTIRSDRLAGVSLTRRGDQALMVEHLLIEPTGAGGMVYLASPGGRQPPTAFHMETLEAQRVVFANPDHDFPQRIMYERRQDRLTATIEGERDGAIQRASWSFDRAGSFDRAVGGSSVSADQSAR